MTVTVDVISDVICPWCWVGKRRLEKAVAAAAGRHAVVVRWHPFQLNPDMPRAGIERRAYRTAKFGSWEWSLELDARLAAVGAGEGIEFAFDRIAHTPNTLDAHRLIRLAGERGVQDAVVEALFRAYFTLGRDVGDRETLLDVTAGAGLDRDVAAADLNSKDGLEAVRADEGEARRLGVQGVPFFIVNGELTLSGAQEPGAFLAAFERVSDAGPARAGAARARSCPDGSRRPDSLAAQPAADDRFLVEGVGTRGVMARGTMSEDGVIVWVLGVVFLATLVRSTLGFGEALVAVPLLALVLPVEVAAPMAVLVSVTVAAVVVLQDRRHVQFRSAGRLVLATVPGIPLGLLLLTAAPEPAVKAVLAAVIVAFSAYCLARRTPVELRDDRLAWAFGFGAGVLGGAYGMNGPPLVVYGTLRRWPPEAFRATLQGYFLPASVLGMIGYWAAGLWVPAVTRYYLLSLPLTAAAILLGRWLNRRINDRRFVLYVHAGLVVIGAALLVQSVRR